MHQSGSVLNPGSIGTSYGNSTEIHNSDSTNKEIAKPYSKIEAKVNKDFAQTKLDLEKNTKSKNLGKYDIWDPEEISELPRKTKDERIRPEFEQKFKQKVGTEDVYLGLNENTPSSIDCKEITISVYLPSTVLSEINLEVTSTVLCVQTQKYYFHHYFPYKVGDKAGKAQWVSDKCVLNITVIRITLFKVPIVRED